MFVIPRTGKNMSILSLLLSEAAAAFIAPSTQKHTIHHYLARSIPAPAPTTQHTPTTPSTKPTTTSTPTPTPTQHTPTPTRVVLRVFFTCGLG